MKRAIIFILILCCIGMVHGAEISGDWSVLLHVQNISGQAEATVSLAGQEIAAIEGNLSELHSETDPFSVPVNLVSTDVLTELECESEYDAGYITLPNEAINAVYLTGEVRWEVLDGVIDPDIHIFSYSLEDIPQNPITMNSTHFIPPLVPPLEGGVPPMVYTLLILVLFFLLLYTYADLDNRLYAPVISSLLGSVLAFMLAIMSMNGSVGDSAHVLVNETIINNTTLYAYESVESPMHSGALGWFFVLVGVIMTITSIYLVVEAFWEYKSRIDQDDMDDV